MKHKVKGFRVHSSKGVKIVQNAKWGSGVCLKMPILPWEVCEARNNLHPRS